MIGFDVALDLFPLLAATLACVTCGLLGNFLVLRKLSLMGDAISHSVLPGLVVAFLITTSRSPLIMFVGATVAGLGTVVLVEVIKRLGKVEPGAAMGVVFSVLFALGVLLIERAAVRHVDLDADCVLYGQLEALAWFDAPTTIAGLWSLETLGALPRQVVVLLLAFALAAAFVGLFFKELRISAFDPGLASSLGFNAGVMHYALMAFVAAATVASFEAVGSILVIAMLVCPAATARLLTDRLSMQIAWSVALSIVAALLGYWSAAILPMSFGVDSLNAAGGIAVVSGLLLTVAMLLSPSQGIIARSIRNAQLRKSIAVDDLLASLYRFREQDAPPPPAAAFDLGARKAALATRLVEPAGDAIILTEAGSERATEIISRHRRWETYLVEDAGLSPDHVHETAEQLEHLDIAPASDARTDPHGRDIPQ